MSFNDVNEVTDRHLHILWTNADPTVAELMVMMYSVNSLLNDWWDEVTVILWGSTQRLAVENEKVRFEINNAQEVGVKFTACSSCARELGLIEALEDMNIEVIRWGAKLSMLMQNGKHVLSV